MDMGGSAASGSHAKGSKDEQETASCREESRKKQASSGKSKSPSGRMSPIDVRSESPEDKRKSGEEPV